eukprot:gene1753-3384_t
MAANVIQKIIGLLILGILSIYIPALGSDLPPYWTVHLHQGKTYYYNKMTGLSQWEPPISTRSVESKPQNVTMPLNAVTATVRSLNDSYSASESSQQNITQPSRVTAALDMVRLQRNLLDAENQIEELKAAAKEALRKREYLEGQLTLAQDVRLRLEGRINGTAQERESLLTRIDELETKNREIINDDISDNQELVETVSKLEDDILVLEKLLQEADRNQTMLHSELRLSRVRYDEQQQEMKATANKIKQLESDLQNVAAPRLKVLRSRPIIVRILETFLPSNWTWLSLSKTKATGKSHRTSSSRNGTTSTLDLPDEEGIEGGVEGEGEGDGNGSITTIAALQNNVTALLEVLEEKESVMEDMRKDLQLFQMEAEDRRGAYAVLKEGIDSLSADRDQQATAAATRGLVIMALQARLIRSETNQILMQEALESELQSVLAARRAVEMDTQSRERELESQLALLRMNSQAEANHTAVLVSSLRSSEAQLIKENNELKKQLDDAMLQLNKNKNNKGNVNGSGNGKGNGSIIFNVTNNSTEQGSSKPNHAEFDTWLLRLNISIR